MNGLYQGEVERGQAEDQVVGRLNSPQVHDKSVICDSKSPDENRMKAANLLADKEEQIGQNWNIIFNNQSGHEKLIEFINGTEYHINEENKIRLKIIIP